MKIFNGEENIPYDSRFEEMQKESKRQEIKRTNAKIFQWLATSTGLGGVTQSESLEATRELRKLTIEEQARLEQ